MELNINDTKMIKNPSSDAVIKAIRKLGVEDFVILSRGDENYVQARYNEDETWSLEYRDGSADRHFSTTPEETSRDNVCQAFAAYAENKNLSEILAWEQIEVSATEPGEGEVEYNGVIMDAEWPAQIEAAQAIKTIPIDGKNVKRIQFGREKDAGTEGLDNCGDCGVLRGQFHVPSCDIEQCPVCLGQLVSCGCCD